jgi:hypothetical protein
MGAEGQNRVRVPTISSIARAPGRLAFVVAALWSLSLLTAHEVRADSRDDEARVLFEKGVEASDAQHWVEAIDAFRRSLALVERPSTRFNLITALYRHGEYQEATEVARAYLSLTDPEKDKAKRAEVEKLLADMRDDIGTLVLDITPSNAQVRIDGTLLPAGQRHELPLTPGKHEVILSAEGYAPRIETVTVDKGVRTLVLLRLTPLANVTPGTQAASGPQSQADLLEVRRRNELHVRVVELDREMAKLSDAIAAANRKKPLIYLGLGTAFLIGGITTSSVAETEGAQLGGIPFAIAGGSFLLASLVSGLVRRSKRGHYQRRLDRFAAEKEALKLELDALVAPQQQSVGLRLRF